MDLRRIKSGAAILVGTLVSFVVGASGTLSQQFPDLGQIGHVAPKCRVQDREYNPRLPVVTSLIKAGPAAIPFLVSRLEDDTEIKGHVFDYWPRVAVGDVALVL